MPEGKVRVIEAVKTPIAFFVLVVLLVEGIFLSAAVKFPDERHTIIICMILLIFMLVGIVAFLSYCRPEALRGVRVSEDQELAKIRQMYHEMEHLVDKITGNWTFVTHYQAEGAQQTIEARGSCEIKKGKYGIFMNGNTLEQEGKPSVPFIVKQVFMNEDGLTYIYELPQDLGRAILGVGQVRFTHAEGESLITQMKGNWAVLGSKLSGRAEFNRKR